MERPLQGKAVLHVPQLHIQLYVICKHNIYEHKIGQGRGRTHDYPE